MIALRTAIAQSLFVFVLAQVSLNPGVCADPLDSNRTLRIDNCRVKIVDDVQLACERSGTLERVAPAGNYVRAGDVLAQLHDSAMSAHLAILEKEAANDIETRFAKKAQQLAQLKYERALEADRAVGGTVTDFELRELRLAAEKTLLQLEQAEYQRQLAELRRQEQLQKIQSLRIVAPFDGLVRATHKRPSEVVSEGETIVELVNTDRVRIEGFVSIKDLARVRSGASVQVWLPQSNHNAEGNRQRFYGRITLVDVKVEPVAQKVKVWAEVQNQNGLLRDGLLATMVVQTQTTTTADHGH